MTHSEFKISEKFTCGDHIWMTTDVGSRVIVAIQIDEVNKLNYEDAKSEGWFVGPPYAVNETVFDEYDIVFCKKY